MGVFKNKSQYLMSLAIANRLIAHDAPAPDTGGKRESFFRMNDEEELMAGCVNWAHFPCMVFAGFSGRFTSNDRSVSKRLVTTELFFLHKADPTNMNDIETAYDISFDVMQQLISRMFNDFEENGSCSPFDNLDLSRFNFSPVGPIGPGLYGWQLLFSDEKFAKDILDYDASKWF
ncbi:MAG: hypothetical protein ACTHMV_13530 [Chitinophagaceae bacterium]